MRSFSPETISAITFLPDDWPFSDCGWFVNYWLKTDIVSENSSLDWDMYFLLYYIKFMDRSFNCNITYSLASIRLKSSTTRPEVSVADPQRNKSMQKVTERCLICQVSIINPEISSSTAIYRTWPEVYSQSLVKTSWPDLTWSDVTWLDMEWHDLIWPDLTWHDLNLPDLKWPSLTWLDLTWPDLTWKDLTWTELTGPDRPDLSWPNLTYLILPHLTWPYLTKPELTWADL